MQAVFHEVRKLNTKTQQESWRVQRRTAKGQRAIKDNGEEQRQDRQKENEEGNRFD